MSALLHFGKSRTSRSLGVECFQPSLDITGKLCNSSSCISSPHSVQVSSRTCHRSIQISNSSGTLLDVGSLNSHNFQHVGRHSSSVFCCGGSCHGCFSRLGTPRSTIAAFNPLAIQRWVLCRQGFYSSVCQAKAYQQFWDDWVIWCAWEGLPNNYISALNILILHSFI